MNRAIRRLRPHTSKAISEAVAGMPGVLDLTVGAPYFGPPRALLDSLSGLLASGIARPTEHDHYAPARGVVALRDAIAVESREVNGCVIDPDTQVLVTNGAAEGIWTAILACTDGGDEVLLPDPCYMLYEPIIHCLGRRAVRIPAGARYDFRLDPDVVAHVASKRASALIVNTPANPTGVCLDRLEIEALGRVAEQNDMLVIADEVLGPFCYAQPHLSIGRLLAPDRVVTVNSFSKRYGMTGWRLGWMTGSPGAIEVATKAHTFMTLAVNHVLQAAVARVMLLPEVRQESERHAREVGGATLRLHRDLMATELFTPAPPPDGGFYLFLDYRPLTDALGPRSSEAVARVLLRAAAVAVVPGSAFGREGEGYLRFSAAGAGEHLDRVQARLEGLVHAARALPQD